MSIIARDILDLEGYPGYGKAEADMSKHELRFNYCICVAKLWFEYLGELKTANDNSLEKEELLKQDLKGKTIIGELVGLKSSQHILSYEKEALVFSSLVENDSSKNT